MLNDCVTRLVSERPKLELSEVILMQVSPRVVGFPPCHYSVRILCSDAEDCLSVFRFPCGFIRALDRWLRFAVLISLKHTSPVFDFFWTRQVSLLQFAAQCYPGRLEYVNHCIGESIPRTNFDALLTT